MMWTVSTVGMSGELHGSRQQIACRPHLPCTRLPYSTRVHGCPTACCMGMLLTAAKSGRPPQAAVPGAGPAAVPSLQAPGGGGPCRLGAADAAPARHAGKLPGRERVQPGAPCRPPSQLTHTALTRLLPASLPAGSWRPAEPGAAAALCRCCCTRTRPGTAVAGAVAHACGRQVD